MTKETLKTSQQAPLMEQLLYEVKKVIVGQDHLLERVLVRFCRKGICWSKACQALPKH